MYITAENEHADVVKLLLEHKADANQAKTTDGSTPVYVAAGKGHIDVVKELVTANIALGAGATLPVVTSTIVNQ